MTNRELFESGNLFRLPRNKRTVYRCKDGEFITEIDHLKKERTYCMLVSVQDDGIFVIREILSELVPVFVPFDKLYFIHMYTLPESL